MKIFIAFIAFLAMALMLGALLSYPMYQLISLWTPIPFEKLVTKTSQLIALLSILPFLAVLQLKTRQATALNLSLSAFAQQYARGLALGVLTLVVLAMMLMLLDIRTLDPDYAFTFDNLLKTVVVGLVLGTLVALIEEIFFRGVMLTGISRSMAIMQAAFLTALLYAGIHFFKSKGVVLPHEPNVLSGFVVLGQISGKIFLYENLDSFLALFTVGLFLAMVRIRTGHIAQCIGIHASWVMVIKTIKDLTDSNGQSAYSHWTGSYDGIIGWLAFGYLSLLCAAYYFFLLRRSQNNVHTA